jgi:hypothetical protein
VPVLNTRIKMAGRQGHRVKGCGGSIASVWKCNQNINLRTYITHNENIASCNVLHQPFIRIYQLFSYWILAYEMHLEAKCVVSSIPSLLSIEFANKTGFCLPDS